MKRDKYYVMTVLTRCGDHDFLTPYAFNTTPTENVEEVSKDILKNWYEDDLDRIDEDGIAWFHNGNACNIDRMTEVTQKQFDILKLLFF